MLTNEVLYYEDVLATYESRALHKSAKTEFSKEMGYAGAYSLRNFLKRTQNPVLDRRIREVIDKVFDFEYFILMIDTCKDRIKVLNNLDIDTDSARFYVNDEGEIELIKIEAHTATPKREVGRC